MQIEINYKVFSLIFSVAEPIKTEKKELFIKNTYHNKENEITGFEIYNHITQIWQYYLQDINA